jgi:arginyl-tRNA synthetase
MHRFAQMRQQSLEIIQQLQSEGTLPADLATDNITVDLPRDASHGDMAINAAMVLAKPAGMNPRALAELLVEKLKSLPAVEKVEIAGPGFINLTMQPAYWQSLVIEVLNAGLDYGNGRIGAGMPVNVEYVSANPTGPMHVGHVRGAVFGDALARLLAKAGYAVTKEYYINDAGAQTDKLADSAFVRYREALGEVIGEIPEGLYPGDYLVPVGTALVEKFGNTLLSQDRAQWLPVVKDIALAMMMDMIRDDLALLDIRHDVFTSEAAITAAGKVEEGLAALEAKGMIYQGVLEKPKGKEIEDWEPRPQTLFKSTEFGDDVDRALKKADGSWTYFAPDVALHYDKYKRGFNRMVNIFGADHGGYVKRIRAAVTALSGGEADVDVKLCQMVKFLRNGQPAKMSKRAGTFVTAREVVEEVGRDVTRFMMLTRKSDAPLDFDFEKVMEQSKDNPVFYVQYAHARIKSVLRHASVDHPALLAAAQQADAWALSVLTDAGELALLKRMAFWPRLVESAASAYEPHRVAFYLQELAADFHSLWNQGQENAQLRFILPDAPEQTVARLALVQACATVLATGMAVMGVEPVEELRA